MASGGRQKCPGLKTFARGRLPPAVHRFLFGHSADFPLTHLVVCALFGAVSGTVLFLGIVHNLPVTFDLKVTVGVLFVVVCMVGGALSSSIRCCILLVFPSMLGSRGRSYLMLLTMSVLYAGPITNIQRNAEGAAMSLSCNLELQLRHSRLLWRESIRPFVRITRELMHNTAQFQSRAQNVSRNFQRIRDEMVRQFGYDGFRTNRAEGDGNTQQQFEAKTLTQCTGVVERGMQRCSDWFDRRWAECLEAIPVPVIKHILCLPMRFTFLCDVIKVMTPWCKQNVPVEGNFGMLFDQLNSSVDQLSQEFSTEVHLEEEQEQEVLSGTPLEQEYTESLKESFRRMTFVMGQVLDVLQVALSFTFITLFTRACGYLRNYRGDICFDNVYLSSYFRRMDALKKRAGKLFLLPLRKSERNSLIDPRSLKIHPEELKQVTSGLFQIFTVFCLSAVLLLVDFALFHILDVISRHTFTQFNVTSSHQVDIKVGGASMMAHLLRSTISAFNSSSNFSIHSTNRECMATPSPLPATVYISCVSCVLLAALLSCVQVYTNRLRRVIAAFYNPEIEKKRVLYLHNLVSGRLQMKERRRRPLRRCDSGTAFQRFTRWGRRLWREHTEEGSEQTETHYADG